MGARYKLGPSRARAPPRRFHLTPRFEGPETAYPGVSGSRRALVESGRGYRLALLAVSSLVAGLGAEVVLRVWFPEIGKLRNLVVSTDDERGFAPKPGVEI